MEVKMKLVGAAAAAIEAAMRMEGEFVISIE